MNNRQIHEVVDTQIKAVENIIINTMGYKMQTVFFKLSSNSQNNSAIDESVIFLFYIMNVISTIRDIKEKKNRFYVR